MGTKITKIGITSDKISARGGLPLFLRFIDKIRLYNVISGTIISLLSINNKGLQLKQFLKQMFAFFMDGTNMSISGFDRLKNDEGYTALLENKPQEMASSHQIKRFFIKLSVVTNFIFNKIMHELFVWRLQIAKPSIIELGIDTMVMDNDGAKKREGNETTYKKKKGFQPLHICWGPFLIDVLFRKGSAHSNHGTDYIDRVKAIVNLIRKRYSENVPIVICADSGLPTKKHMNILSNRLAYIILPQVRYTRMSNNMFRISHPIIMVNSKKTRLYGILLNLATSFNPGQNSGGVYLQNYAGTKRANT